MHVGLNLGFLVPGETGGTETVARELLPRLAATPGVVVTAFVSPEAADSDGPWHRVPSVRLPSPAANRLGLVAVEQMLLPRLAVRAGVDVLHSLANTAPARGRFARVVTVHDLIHRAHPGTHSGVRAQGLALLVPLAARRADRIIAVSQATAETLTAELGVSPAKIDVAPNGAGAPSLTPPTPEAELRDRYGLGSRPLLLTVSAKRSHKNLSRLLDAQASLAPGDRPVLVMPGYPTDHELELRGRAAELNVEADVRFPGWIPAADLEGLYRTARGFVFPSLYEGFGLPVLEAMARGLPVACSDRGALAEVAGDAALRFDPESTSAIADAIRRLLGDSDLVSRLRAAGPARAALFTWERNAELTLASYERAIRERRGKRPSTPGHSQAPSTP